jgi:hypothetical protein
VNRFTCWPITGVVNVREVLGRLAGKDIVVAGMSQMTQWTKPLFVSTRVTA